MIQRVQSLYLLGASIMFLLMFKFPLLEVIADTGVQYSQFVAGVKAGGKEVYDTLPLTVYVLVMVLLSFANIFLFKKRTLQIRLTIYTMVLTMGSYIVIWFSNNSFINEMEIAISLKKYGFSMVFPFVALVLLYLALSGIRKDDALLRSVDRLR